MASRYDSVDGGQQANDFTERRDTTERTDQTQSVRGRQTTTGSQTTREQALTEFDIDRMSGAGRGALENLLAELAAGGTEEQRRNREEQLNTLRRLRAEQEQYTRETALEDAEGLVQHTLNQAMEQAMPSILQAGAQAGTSGDAISALLSQDAATRASGEAARVGTDAVQGYGSILANLMGSEAAAADALEDEAVQSLLQALQIDSGSRKRGTERTDRTSTTRSQEQTQSQQDTTTRGTTRGTTIVNRSPNDGSGGGAPDFRTQQL